MLTRRRFLTSSLLAGVMPLPLSGLLQAAQSAAAPAPGSAAAEAASVGEVDVFVGTGGHGHTFPGATLPFGMVQLSPDTYNAVWDSCSGYHQGDGSIMGFSHTHLSGTGIGDMLDVLVMPNVGVVKTVPGQPSPPIGMYRSRFDAVHPETTESIPTAPAHEVDSRASAPGGYRAPFSRDDEQAEPGYYRVHLRDRNVLVELTATARAGMHRYTFPASDESHFIVDLKHGMQDNSKTPTRVDWAQLQVIGRDTLTGGRIVSEWATGRHIYFALKFSRPFDRIDLYDDQKLHADTLSLTAKNIVAAVHMKTHANEQVLVKVGISAVSAEGAMRNLDAEIPGWNFDAVRTAAKQAWSREMSGVRADTLNSQQRTIFYSALYHSMIAPTLFDDVDGQYRGMDLAVHALSPGQRNYTAYSLWDTYRALHPLLTLVQPHRVPDLVNTLIRMAEQSPDGVPVWPLQGCETGCMTGYHSAVVLAEAQSKGFRGIDFAKAWPLWRKRAMDEDYRGLAWYRKQGFIGADQIEEAASKTLEYAYDDWAMAHLAKAAGAPGDARLLLERSRNYQHLFDTTEQFIHPKMADGSWTKPFDPRAMGHSDRWRDFTESNAWQATFLNQHDVHAYIKMFGGDEAFVAKLDALFAANPELPPNAPPDIAGLLGQYAHGNEPSHHVAYLYAYAGQPWKTQALVRRLLDTMYAAAPDGEAGNDDCGQISAWYVLSALGFYAVDPVSGNYVFGSPLITRATLALAEGQTLLIEAHNNSAQNVYVQSIRWNGTAHPKNWIGHSELAVGGHLEFVMGPKPNVSFGAEVGHRPPSYVM